MIDGYSLLLFIEYESKLIIHYVSLNDFIIIKLHIWWIHCDTHSVSNTLWSDDSRLFNKHILNNPLTMDPVNSCFFLIWINNDSYDNRISWDEQYDFIEFVNHFNTFLKQVYKYITDLYSFQHCVLKDLFRIGLSHIESIFSSCS